MSISDHAYVNFSQEHELNYHLQKVNKRQTEANRSILKNMGQEYKAKTGKHFITHAEFHAYIKTQLHRLE
jgi:hypothetical protein